MWGSGQGAVPCALGCCPSRGYLPISFPLLMTESVPAQAQRDGGEPGRQALTRGLQPSGRCLRAGMGEEPFRGAGEQAGKRAMLDAQPWGVPRNLVSALWMGSPWASAPGSARGGEKRLLGCTICWGEGGQGGREGLEQGGSPGDTAVQPGWRACCSPTPKTSCHTALG